LSYGGKLILPLIFATLKSRMGVSFSEISVIG
jgi:hypothetical protein